MSACDKVQWFLLNESKMANEDVKALFDKVGEWHQGCRRRAIQLPSKLNSFTDENFGIVRDNLIQWLDTGNASNLETVVVNSIQSEMLSIYMLMTLDLVHSENAMCDDCGEVMILTKCKKKSENNIICWRYVLFQLFIFFF